MRAFAPATVSNVGPGFDVFGFAIEGLGDVVEARAVPRPGVVVERIFGDGGVLPREASKNTAGIAAAAVLRAAGAEDQGVALALEKGMPLSSGLGSSAASGVAAAVAVDALLVAKLPREVLLRCAVEAEEAACGAAHGDNAAPSLYGGFVMVRPTTGEPTVGRPAMRVDPLPVPEGLCCALIRPHRKVDTGAARALLGETVPLKEAIIQWGNSAALVAGLFRGDWELLASALHDAVAEPLRGPHQPGFLEAQKAALEAGALGCSLSGSGPAIFALCRGEAVAEAAAQAMAEALKETAGVDCDQLVSPVGATGARVLQAVEAVPCPT